MQYARLCVKVCVYVKRKKKPNNNKITKRKNEK